MISILSKYIGQPVCVALYAVFTQMAIGKKYIPLALLVALHTTEYFIIGKGVGEKHNINPLKTLLMCLMFGFTWWVPIKNNFKK